MTALGLGFLALSIGHSLGELTALLHLSVRRAWDAPKSMQPRQQIQLAGRDFARCGAILIRLVLQGIAMWLTKKGADKVGELVAQLRNSKLGPRFAAWVEENAAALMRDPRLKPHRGQGSASKGVVSEAQSPSRLANRPKEETPPPPSPSPSISEGQQGKHVPGHNNYQPGKSELTDPNPQGLLDQGAGKGQAIGNTPVGQAGSKERVNFGKEIGNYVDPVTGEKTPTTNGIIHHGSRGVHIVPSRP